MKLSLVMIGIFGALMALDAATPGSDGFGWVAFAWFWVTAWTLGIYWIVRVVRVAWRSGSRAHE